MVLQRVGHNWAINTFTFIYQGVEVFTSVGPKGGAKEDYSTIIKSNGIFANRFPSSF